MNRFGDAPVQSAPSPRVNRFGDQPAPAGDGTPTPNLDRFVQQIQPGLDSTAASLARGAIAAQQQGLELVKTVNPDGTATYTPTQVRPAAPVSAMDKTALIQAYQQEYAGRPIDSNQGYDEMARAIQYRTAQENSALQNFSGAAADTMARIGTGVAGMVAPQTANQLNQNLGYNYDPETKAAFAGQVVGNTLPLVPAIASGNPLLASNITAGILGGSQFGSVRSEIAQRRQRGEQISTGQELLAAGLSAAAEFAGERVGLGSITAVEKAALKNAVANSLLQYAKAAATNASEEAITQIAQNAVDIWFTGKDSTLMEGVGRAALTGAAVGVAGRGLHGLIGHGEVPNAPQQQGVQPYEFAQPVSQTTPVEQGQGGIPLEPHGNLNTVPLAGERVADQNPIPLEPAAAPAKPQEILAPDKGPVLPPMLQEATPKHRIQNGAESRGVPVEFESAIDKALYVAGQPRKGKLQAEALKFLSDQNVDMGRVKQVQEAVEQYAISLPSDAKVINVPPVNNTDTTIPFANPTTNERAATQIPVQVPQSNQPPIRLNSPGFSSVQEVNSNAEASPSKAKPIPLAGEGRVVVPQNGPAVSKPVAEVGKTPQTAAAGQSSPQVADVRTANGPTSQLKTFLPDETRVRAAVQDAEKSTKDFKASAPKTREQAEAGKAFGRLGVKVVYYEGEGRAFRMKRHPGVLFVNTKNVAEGLREAVSHEFMHELHDSRPGLFQEFRDAIPEDVRQEFEDWYTDAFQAQRPGETPAALNEEGVTTPFGRTAVSDRVWQAALGQKPTLVQKVVDFFREFAAKFHTKSKLVQQAVKTFEAVLQNPVSSTDSRRGVVASRVDFLPSPNEEIRQQADEYAQQAGIRSTPNTEYATVDVDRAKQIADWYDAAQHSPNDPQVQRAYDAMKKETLDQWKFLESKGVKFEAWKKEGQPYADSQEMMKDVTNNRHLYFFTGGDIPADHPLAEKAPVPGNLTYNDVFRAVHDYFGHAKEGVGFGPRGEENAWRQHSQMYSATARPAMSAETRGQNSWVNYGPHGEANRANPENTHYAEQKAVLLPQKWVRLSRSDEVQAVKSAGQALGNTLRKTARVQAGTEEFAPNFLPQKEEGPRRKKQKEEAVANLNEEDRSIWNKLTPEEQSWVTSPGVKRVAESYREVRKSMPSEQWQAAIRAGMPMRKWYQKATAAIKTIFQDDAPLFTALLAADSPRQKVDKNLQESLRMWLAWDDAGRPTNPEQIKAIADKHVKLATRIPNVVRALTGDALNGPKVNSFGENLLGNLQFVTNDTWMAQFSGLNEEFFKDDASYLGYTAAVRDEALKAGIEPAEAQAAVWSFFSVLANSVNSQTLGRDALARLNGEKVANANKFDLIDDESVRQSLTQAGYSEDAIRSAAAAAEAITATENAGHKLTAADKQILLPLAERAEKVAKHQPNYEKIQKLEENRGGNYDDLQLPDTVKPDDDIAFLPAGLRTRGQLPEDVAQANSERMGDIASEQKRAEFATANLNRAIRQDFGVSARKLAPADVEQLNEALKGNVPVSNFKPATAAAIQAMRDHVDSLTTKLMGTSLVDPRLAAILGDNLGKYLNRSYRVFDDPKWAAKVPPPVMANAIKFIEGQLVAQGKSPALAPTYVDELLQDWKQGGVDSLFSKGKLGSKNLAILKARKDIAPEIRALMGEYNNPFVNYVKSVSKMSSLLSAQNFLESIKSTGMGSWLFDDDSAKPGYTTRIAAPESSSMSPLNGLRTSPEIAKAFEEMYKSEQLPGWARVLMTANFIAKSSKTVFSLMTQMRNLIGQPYFNLLNGHFRINKYGKSFKALAADLRSKGDAGMQAYVQDLAKYGILGQGVNANEVMNDLKDIGITDTDLYTESGFLPTMKRVGKAALKAPQTAYQVSDHLGKIYGFENEMARSREINPGFTDEEHKAWAAERVLNTYPTYSKIPPAIQKLRRQPFVGPFVAFWYESMRTAGNSALYAYKDLVHGKNVHQRRAGAERLAGLATVAGGSLAVEAISKALLGIGDDDEEGFRKFLPDWSKGNTFLFTGKDDQGNWSYIDLSGLNPYSPIIDSLNSIIGGNEKPMDRLAGAVEEFFKPLVSEAIFTKALREVASNKKDTGGRIYNPEDTLVNQWKDVLGHLFSAIEPGTLDRLRHRIIPGLKGQETSYGDKIEPKNEIAAELTGIKARSFNFSSGLSFQGRAFGEAGGNITNLFLREITRPGKIDKDVVIESYNAMEDRRFSQWADLHDKAMHAKKAGLSVRDIYSALLRGGVGPDTAKQIIVGRYEPYSLQSEAVKQAFKLHGSELPLKDMAAIYRERVGRKLAEEN